MLIYLFFPFLALFVLALLRSRCPKCGRRKLQLQEQIVVGRNAFYELVEDVYRCQKCGAVVRKRHRDYFEQNNHGGGSLGGPFIGGFGGGSFGGGSMGGGFGGGHFGGGGAGSRW